METERERIIKLEEKHLNLMEKIDGIFNRFDLLEEKIDKALEKKAGVWVEKAIIGFVIFVLTGLGGYVGALIYKAIIHMN